MIEVMTVDSRVAGASKIIEHSPISSPRSQVVHAVTLHEPTKTACGRKMQGWHIALRAVTCRDCKLAIGHDCRKKKRA